MFAKNNRRLDRYGVVRTLTGHWKQTQKKFCFNCDVTFFGKSCPWCDGHEDSWVWLSSWERSSTARILQRNL